MNRLRVLVADDDPTVRLLIGAALPAALFDVMVVADGIAVMDDFRPERFDVVVLDVEMPGVDGLTLAEHVRSLAGDALPVVLMTGRDDPTFQVIRKKLGAHHLPKPLDWSGLGSFLRALS